MHTFCSFCTPITNHEGQMSMTVWCLQSYLIKMHTPLFLRSLQVACCMAPVAPSTHIALAWLTTFVQKATLRLSQSTPPTPPAPTQHTTAEMMAAHLNGKCAGSRTMHLDYNMHDYAAMLALIDLWHHSRNNCCLVAIAAGVGLPLTTAGWCPTTRTYPCSAIVTLTWRSAPLSRLSNTSTNTSTRATIVHRWT
jgi:hypothetical protein